MLQGYKIYIKIFLSLVLFSAEIVQYLRFVLQIGFSGLFVRAESLFDFYIYFQW